MHIEIRTMSELVDELRLSTGEEGEHEICLEKIECINTEGNPGDTIVVLWKVFDYVPLELDESDKVHFEFSDIGYIFTLPEWDSEDIWLGGVAHFPNPNNPLDLDSPPPIWATLLSLSNNDAVKRILICRRISDLSHEDKQRFMIS